MITIVIGKARAGKTTFSRALAKETNAKAACTSDVVYEVVALARGCAVEELKRLPKEELRPCLIKTADYLCDIKPDFLSEALINRGFTIIDGVRRTSELVSVACKYKVLTVYIERPDNTVEDNFAIIKGLANVIIHNDGSVEDLEKKARQFSLNPYSCEL